MYALVDMSQGQLMKKATRDALIVELITVLLAFVIFIFFPGKPYRQVDKKKCG
jgi:hypothetical protein